MKLSNRQIGAVGVQRVAGALLRSGYSVLTPLEDFVGYDLVAERGGKFHRIQVKTTTKTEGNRIFYRFMTSCGVDSKTAYSKKKTDFICCWAMDEDLFWLFKPGDCTTTTKVHPGTGKSWRILNDL
jgi:hypothetical protein